MLTSSGNADAGPGAAGHAHAFEILPEVHADAAGLDEDLRRAIADIVVAVHEDPRLGELMDARWPGTLAGCRKIRFDTPAWNGEPRYRFIHRSDPREGATGSTLLLAIGPRHGMVAYAQAAGRLMKREAAKRTPGAGTRRR
jgi:hypothetical protein